MANVKFLRGSLANYLALQNKSNDSIYITTDEGGIYLGSKRLGDYILVDSIANLPNVETEAISTNALYYAAKENVLARFNGDTWVQINAAGLTKVKYNGQNAARSGDDYVTGITINTNANGTERYLDIATSKIEDHATIKQAVKDIEDLQTSVGALLGDGEAGSIEDMISSALAPVTQAVKKAQSDATSAINTNTTQQASIDDHETRIGKAETAITNEVTNRQTAITNLIDGASDGYQTLGDLEAKIKAADEKAQGAVNVNGDQQSEIDDLERRMGLAETNISNEVTNRQTAITNLINGASAEYNTLAGLEAKIKLADAKAQGAVDTNGTQQEELDDHESRLGAVEGVVAKLDGSGEGSVKKQVANAIAGVVANADDDFDTLKEIADWILNDKTGAAALQSDVATLKTDVADHETRLGNAEDAISDNADAIAQEVKDRQAAITGLVNGASAEYNTLAGLEAKIKLAQGDADDNAAALGELEGRVGANETAIEGHTTAIGENKTAIENEVTARQNAINGLVNGEEKYTTLKKVGDKFSTLDSDMNDLEDRVGANETAIGGHTTAIAENTRLIGVNTQAIAQEVTDRQAAITGLVNGETTYTTLKAAGDELRNHETRVGNLESQLEWGSF